MAELKPGIYEHYKGGRYEVIGVAFHSEKIEDRLVVYKMLYDREPFTKGQLCVRPLEMFLETVKVEGKDIPRFRFVEPSKDSFSRLRDFKGIVERRLEKDYNLLDEATLLLLNKCFPELGQ